MNSKMQNGRIELIVGRANDALEDDNHDECVYTTLKMQKGKIDMLSRANKVLENGTHDEHVDMTPEILNREIIHDSKLTRVYNKLGNESHIIQDEYADMDSEVQTKDDTKVGFEEKVSELDVKSMNTVSNNSSNNRTAIPNDT